MPQNEGYIRWPTNQDIPLALALFDDTGAGVTGATPEVSVRRYRETRGVLLDNWFWNAVEGIWFEANPVWWPMVEIDSVNSPGLYIYPFEQTKVGVEQIYAVYFRHTSVPEGFAVEHHIITNEVYIPSTQPNPIVIGPETVMGQMELVKDGGTGLFNGLEDSLHFLKTDTARILGMLHRNALLDNHQFDSNGQLTWARLRVFDSAGNIPTVLGGSETVGLLHEYEVKATYAGLGVPTSFSIEQVT